MGSLSKKRYALLIIVLLISINSIPSIFNEKTLELQITKFNLIESEYKVGKYYSPKGSFNFETEFNIINKGGLKIVKLPVCGPPKDINVKVHNMTDGNEISHITYNVMICDGAGTRGYTVVPPFKTLTVSLEMEFVLPIGNYSLNFNYNRLTRTDFFIDLEIQSLEPIEIDLQILEIQYV